MNIYQRIILILGAMALFFAILTTPLIVQPQQGTYLKHDRAKYPQLAPTRDPRVALIHSVAVVGTTLLLFFAFKESSKNEES